MTGFFRIILFFIIFLIVLKLFRTISKSFFSSKKTVKDINQQRSKKPQSFDDVEEADFREIPTEKKKESENN